MILSAIRFTASAQDRALAPLLPGTPALTSDKIVRDESASNLIAAALAAFGGIAAVRSAKDSSATGNFDGPAGKGYFHWIDAGWEFRDRYRPSDVAEWSNSLYSSHGAGKMESGEKVQHLSPHQRVQHLPFENLGRRLIQIIDSPASSLGTPMPKVIDGHSVSAVKIHFGLGYELTQASTQTWYFDDDTKLPLAIDYFESDAFRPGRGSITRAHIDSYQTVSGLKVPFLISLSTITGDIFIRYQVAEVQYNRLPESTVFDEK